MFVIETKAIIVAVLTPSNRIAQADCQTRVSTGADLPQRVQVRPTGWRRAPKHTQSINFRCKLLLWNWRTGRTDESDRIITDENYAYLHSIGDDC